MAFTDSDRQLLTSMNREIGEVKVDVKNIKGGLKWRANVALAFAITAFGAWFK